MSSIAVFSCYFGDPEPFNTDTMGRGEGYDRILFTDREDLVPPGVERRLCGSAALGPAHESRRAKLMPHLALPEYDWTIYVDNRASLTRHPDEIIAGLGASPAPGRYVYAHPERSSVFEELDTCFLIGHLDEVQWRTLDELYIRSALPNDLALTHNAVMICKAGDANTDRMSEMWFEMFLRYCKRDQLTMQLAEHLSGARANRMDGKLTDIAKWPVFMPQDRDKSVIPPDLFKPKAKLSLARRKFKRLQKQKMALIEKRQSMR